MHWASPDARGWVCILGVTLGTISESIWPWSLDFPSKTAFPLEGKLEPSPAAFLGLKANVSSGRELRKSARSNSAITAKITSRRLLIPNYSPSALPPGPVALTEPPPPPTRDPGIRESSAPNYISRHALQRPFPAPAPPLGGAALGTGRWAAGAAGSHSPFRCGSLSNPGPGVSGAPGLPLARRAAPSQESPERAVHPTFCQAFAPGAPSVTEWRGWAFRLGRTPPRPRKRLVPGGGGGGRRDACGAGRLTAGVGAGPVPQISVAGAGVRPAPWPPPPPPQSISRNFTRSSAASMKTCEGCRKGSWGWQGQVRRGRDEPWGTRPRGSPGNKSHPPPLLDPVPLPLRCTFSDTPPRVGWVSAPRISLLPLEGARGWTSECCLLLDPTVAVKIFLSHFHRAKKSIGALKSAALCFSKTGFFHHCLYILFYAIKSIFKRSR